MFESQYIVRYMYNTKPIQTISIIDYSYFFIQIKKMCLTTDFIEFIIVSTSNVRFKHIETLGGVHIDERETPRNNS